MLDTPTIGEQQVRLSAWYDNAWEISEWVLVMARQMIVRA